MGTFKNNRESFCHLLIQYISIQHMSNSLTSAVYIGNRSLEKNIKCQSVGSTFH
jgi:hypothetical protein